MTLQIPKSVCSTPLYKMALDLYIAYICPVYANKFLDYL